MARSINQLLNLCELDIRPYLGTIRDWSPNALSPYFITTGGSPEFRRTNGQLVGIHVTAARQAVGVASIDVPANFTIEMVFRWNGEVWAGDTPPRFFFAQRISDGNWAVDVRTGNLAQVGIYSSGVGGNVGIPAAMQPDISTLHLIVRRTGTVGEIATNGQVQSTTATVGTSTGACIIGIGGQEDGFRGWPGSDWYLCRFYNEAITNEECSLLYEHARPLLTPGAPKRSGILSVR